MAPVTFSFASSHRYTKGTVSVRRAARNRKDLEQHHESAKFSISQKGSITSWRAYLATQPPESSQNRQG